MKGGKRTISAQDLIPALILLGAVVSAWRTDTRTRSIDAAMWRFALLAALALVAAVVLDP